jgi:serine protease
MRPFVRLSGPVAPVALLLAAVAGWLTTTAAQQPERRGGSKEILSDISAPGIDRGLRDADFPRPAHTASSRRWVADGGRGAYLRDSLIVRFRPGTLPAAQRALLAQVDATAGPAVSYADFEIVTLADGDDPEAVARRLSEQPDVEYAQARYRVRPRFVPSDPLYSSQQWNFPQIDMERAWDINRGGSADVVVAIVDSGVAFRSGTLRYTAFAWQRPDGALFPALGSVDVPFAPAPDLGTDRFVSPRDFIWDDNLPFDLAGHGTHVAGTVGQLTNNGMGVAGMAFNVKLMPVKVVDAEWDFIFDSPFIGTDDTVARGLRYAADNGAKVINLSLGRDGDPAPVVQSALQYAVSRGAFVAVAGGNEGAGSNAPERFAEIAPQIDGLVSVAATGRDRRRATYSTVGSFIEVTAPGGDFTRGGSGGGIVQQTIDLALTESFAGPVSRYGAPRFDVFAYYGFEGTSMATAHVSGLAALLISQGLTDPAAIEAILKQSATDLGTPGRDNEYGHGLINARAALRGMGLAR